ncbi:MAG: ABC transporter permease subunit [Cuniculiplasma sp.]
MHKSHFRSALLFDFIHVIRSRFTILMIAFIILLSIPIGTSFTVNITRPNANSPQIYDVYYLSNNSFHIVDFEYNVYGDPVHNAASSFNVNCGSSNYTIHLNTNRAGFVNYTFAPANITQFYSATQVFCYNNLEFFANITLSERALLNNKSDFQYRSLDPNIGVYKPVCVYNQRDPYLKDILLFYMGLNGSSSPAVNITLVESTTSGLVNISNMGKFSGFYVSRLIPNAKLLEPCAPYRLSIRSGSEKIIAWTASIANFQPLVGGMTLELANPQQQIAGLAAGSLNAYFPIIIGLLSAFTVYINYFRLETTNSIEGIISKPISRRKLASSRYSASIFSLLIFSIVGPLAMDLCGYINIGYFMQFGSLLTLMIGLFLASTIITGLLFILSKLARSEGVFFGISFAIIIFTALLWNGIFQTIAIDITHLAMFTRQTEEITLLAEYINPLGPIFLSTLSIPGVTSTFIANRVIPSFSASNPFFPDLTKVIIEGVLWTAITTAIWFKLSIRSK